MSTVSVGLVRLHIHFNELPEDSQGNLAEDMDTYNAPLVTLSIWIMALGDIPSSDAMATQGILLCCSRNSLVWL